MKADVLALGLFHQDIADCLEYPKECYVATKPTTLVFSNLFLCSTTSQSDYLVKLLGVDPWDFNTHLIAPSKISDAARLELDNNYDHTYHLRDLEKFDRLAAAGFKFVYRPDG